jgi:hypothetical protein
MKLRPGAERDLQDGHLLPPAAFYSDGTADIEIDRESVTSKPQLKFGIWGASLALTCCGTIEDYRPLVDSTQ